MRFRGKLFANWNKMLSKFICRCQFGWRVWECAERCKNVDSHTFFVLFLSAVPLLYSTDSYPPNLFRIFIGSRKLTSPFYCAVCVACFCSCEWVPIHTKPNANQMQKDIFSTFVAQVCYVLFSIGTSHYFRNIAAYGFVKRTHLHRNRLDWLSKWVYVDFWPTNRETIQTQRYLRVYIVCGRHNYVMCPIYTPKNYTTNWVVRTPSAISNKMELYMYVLNRACLQFCYLCINHFRRLRRWRRRRRWRSVAATPSNNKW